MAQVQDSRQVPPKFGQQTLPVSPKGNLPEHVRDRMAFSPFEAFEHLKETVCSYLETAYRISDHAVFAERGSLLRDGSFSSHSPAVAQDPVSALTAYRRIPAYKMAPYILHGIAQCHLAKGESIEAAKRLNEAIRREPDKFYHYWDFALALLALGARDQAIEALEKANALYAKEYGRSYSKVQYGPKHFEGP